MNELESQVVEIIRGKRDVLSKVDAKALFTIIERLNKRLTEITEAENMTDVIIPKIPKHRSVTGLSPNQSIAHRDELIAIENKIADLECTIGLRTELLRGVKNAGGDIEPLERQLDLYRESLAEEKEKRTRLLKMLGRDT